MQGNHSSVISEFLEFIATCYPVIDTFLTSKVFVYSGFFSYFRTYRGLYIIATIVLDLTQSYNQTERLKMNILITVFIQ